MGDLSKHFSRHEFLCKCSDPNCSGKKDPDPRLIDGFECLWVLAFEYCEKRGIKFTGIYLTTSIGKNGGNRCTRWNRLCGGVKGSQHRYNKAGDPFSKELSTFELAKLALQVPEFKGGGIGLGGGNIHVDVRKRRTRWKYASISKRTYDRFLAYEKKMGGKK